MKPNIQIKITKYLIDLSVFLDFKKTKNSAYLRNKHIS